MILTFHNHTDASRDCDVSLETIIRRLCERGVEALCVTDHDIIADAAYKVWPIKIIVGEEITTGEGEIIGLYLNSEIQPGQTMLATLNKIHAQGGITIAPHPFDRLRRKVMTLEVLDSCLSEIDAIEVFNARTMFRSDNDRAFRFAKERHKPMIYGSDAHTLSEYGGVTMDGVTVVSASDFLASLATSLPTFSRSSLFVHGITKYVKYCKRPVS